MKLFFFLFTLFTLFNFSCTSNPNPHQSPLTHSNPLQSPLTPSTSKQIPSLNQQIPISNPQNSRFLNEKITLESKKRFSWGDKFKQSLADFLIGCFLFVASFPTLWFNERRAVETDQMINEGSENCLEINPEEVTEKNDCRLVFLTGNCKNLEPLLDSELGIVVSDGLKLVRKVECFQWIEKKTEKENRDMIGGGGDVYYDYDYDKQWTDIYYNSSNFKKADHRNPSNLEWLVKSEAFVSDSAYIGKFLLNKGQILQLISLKGLDIKENDLLEKNLERFQTNYNVLLKNNCIYFSKSKNYEEVGDIRVSYQYINSQFLSLVAMQTGNSFEAYNIKKKGGFKPEMVKLDEEVKNFVENDDVEPNESSSCCIKLCPCCICCGICSVCDSLCHSPEQIDWIYEGKLTKKHLFQKKIEENSLMTYMIRLIGFLSMFFGIYLFFSPLYEILQILPLLSYVGKFLGFVFALAVSIPLTSVVILLAWIFYRPIFLLLLIGIIAPIIGYVYYAAMNKHAEIAVFF